MQPASFLLALATSAIATNAPVDGRSPGNGKAPQAATDLSQCDFSRQKLARKNLCGGFLAGAKVESADFRGTDLAGADLTSAALDQVDFSNATLQGTRAGATLRHTVFSGTQLEAANFAADVWNTNLANALNTGDSLHEALAEPFVAKQR